MISWLQKAGLVTSLYSHDIILVLFIYLFIFFFIYFSGLSNSMTWKKNLVTLDWSQSMEKHVGLSFSTWVTPVQSISYPTFSE